MTINEAIAQVIEWLEGGMNPAQVLINARGVKMLGGIAAGIDNDVEQFGIAPSMGDFEELKLSRGITTTLEAIIVQKAVDDQRFENGRQDQPWRYRKEDWNHRFLYPTP